MDEEQAKAGLELAVKLGVLGRCAVCGATWDRGEIPLEDEDLLDELVDRALDEVEDDAALGLFPDSSVLRQALRRALEDAPAAQACSH
jgi:hypothetical protein